MPQAPSTRWCPTPEQLMILEEMYRTGVRTPNAGQIQQITAHLSYYGKIEGKNVFYWFQNHKARDRQKLRRRLSRQQFPACSSQLPLHVHGLPDDNASSLPPPPPPLPLPLPLSLPSHFFPQLYPQLLPQGGGYHETVQGMDLLRKLEASNREAAGTAEAGSTSSSGAASQLRYGCGWAVASMIPDVLSSGEPSCFQSLKTLELFPTKSTGLKEEGSTSKSSSCSASTN